MHRANAGLRCQVSATAARFPRDRLLAEVLPSRRRELQALARRIGEDDACAKCFCVERKLSDFLVPQLECPVNLDSPGDIDIISNRTRWPPASFLEGPFPEGADDAAYREEASVGRLGPSNQANDRGKLANLQSTQQGGTIADTRIAGEAANIAAAERPRNPAQRFGIEQGIAVNAD